MQTKKELKWMVASWIYSSKASRYLPVDVAQALGEGRERIADYFVVPFYDGPDAKCEIVFKLESIRAEETAEGRVIVYEPSIQVNWAATGSMSTALACRRVELMSHVCELASVISAELKNVRCKELVK